MSKKTALKMTALAAAFAATAVPMTAAAEISGNLAISNMYLWRGLNISGAAAVSGGLDYSHESGFYAGVWTSSEFLRSEYDLFAGYAFEAGGVSVDISYWDYNYPEAMGSDAEEVVVGIGVADFSVGAYIGVGEVGHGDTAADNKNNYYTLGYSYDKFGVTVGTWDNDVDDTNYTHLDLSYALTDNFTFTASKVVAADDFALGATGDSDDATDDLQFAVSYSFDL